MRKTHVARLRKACTSAELIAWDGCHKIYLAMDPASAKVFDDYDIVVTRDEGEDFFEIINEWYEQSCMLKFVDSITNVEEYAAIVPQGS